jgi:hypothetical protein
VNLRLTLLTAVATALSGLAVPGALPAERESSIPEDPSRFLVVDCLLPGQMRRVGGRTYLTPRRPVKAIQSQCAIRGGEYVAYDRANYQTALTVWLPQAESGDAEAQTYVGEIFEKGLGRPVDFAEAAQWYGKAAAQNYSRAQMNLAYLTEQGLGVAKDPLKALNLYRQASGITDDSLTYVSEVTALQQVVDDLTAQLEQQNAEVDRQRVEIESGLSQISTQRSALERAQGDTSRLRSEIERLRTQAAADPVQTAELKRRETDLRTRELKLLEDERAVAELEAATAGQQARLTDQINAATEKDLALQKQLQQTAEDHDELKEQLAETQKRLRTTVQKAASLAAELKGVQAKIAADRELLAKRPVSTTPVDTAERRKLEADLAERERKLASQQVQINSLIGQKDALLAESIKLREQQQVQASQSAQRQSQHRAEVDTLRQELASTKRRLVETEQQIATINGQLKDAEQWIAANRPLLTRSVPPPLPQETARLREEIGRRQAEIVKLQETNSWLLSQRELDQQKLRELQALPKPTAPQPSPSSLARSPGLTPDKVPKDLRFRSYYALIIGIADYSEMPTLKTAVNDAIAVEKVLREKYGFRTNLLETKEETTRSKILEALTEYQKLLKPDDSLLIYYAGHGELRTQNRQSYWLPINSRPDSTVEWISGDQLSDQINQMPARHVMVVADSCYQGIMSRETTVGFKAVEGEAAQIKQLGWFAKLPSRTVLTSGGDKPVLDSGGGAHSIFAQQLLRVLRENNRVLVGAALHNALFGVVRDAAAKLNLEQRPRYDILADAGHKNGEFLFIPVI